MATPANFPLANLSVAPRITNKKNNVKTNPYRYMVAQSPDIQKNFNEKIINATKYVLTKNKGVASSLVETWYENA